MAERRDISDDLDNFSKDTNANDMSGLQRDPYLFQLSNTIPIQSISNIEQSTIHCKRRTTKAFVRRSRSFLSQKKPHDFQIQQTGIADETDSGPGGTIYECREATNQTPGLNEALYDSGVAELKTSTDSIITAETEQSRPGSNEALHVSGNQYGHDVDQSLSLKSSESLDLQKHTLNDIDHGKISETSGQVVMDISGHTNGTVDATFQLTKEVDMRAKPRSSQKQRKTKSSRKQLTRKQTTIEQPATTKRKTQAASSSVSSPAKMAKTTSAATSETKATENMGSGTRGTTEQQPKEDDTMFQEKKEGDMRAKLRSSQKKRKTTSSRNKTTRKQTTVKRPATTKNKSQAASSSASSHAKMAKETMVSGTRRTTQQQPKEDAVDTMFQGIIDSVSRQSTQLVMSTAVRNLCDELSCSAIKELSPDIIHVWEGYKPEESQYQRELLGRIFVVVLKKMIDNLNDKISVMVPFRIVPKLRYEVSDEVKRSLQKETNLAFSLEEHNKIRETLLRYSGDLMKSHSNLNVVSASKIKSKKSAEAESCVVLYVQVKGIIPVNEEAFPKTLGEFRVHVREGIYTTFSDPKLAMGSQIFANENCAKIAGFVFLSTGNIGCLTCSHLFKAYENMEVDDAGPKKEEVYQLSPSKNDIPFGTVYTRIWDKGYCETETDFKIGIDAALIEITDKLRNPNSGDYKHSVSAPFACDDTLDYYSGEILTSGDEVAKLHIEKNMKCKIVRYDEHQKKLYVRTGLISSDAASVRLNVWSPPNNSEACQLFIQMHIRPDRNEIKDGEDGSFATCGDSGSLVFLVSEDGEHMYAFGMVVGGIEDEGSAIATPIWAVLDAFGLPRKFMSFKYLGKQLKDIANEVKDLGRKVEGLKCKMDKQFEQLMIELKKRNLYSDRNESNSNPGDQMQNSANSETQRSAEHEACAKEL